MAKKKTLTQFKRDAASGKMSLELIERFGKTGNDLPEKMRGLRKVTRVNTVAVMLLNQDGVESELRFESANLIDYDCETLVVYNPGMRQLTDEEDAVLAQIYDLQKKYANTYSGGFWQVKEFCQKSSCPWMEGHKTVRGKKYLANKGMVLDNSIKGEAILKYKVYFD